MPPVESTQPQTDAGLDPAPSLTHTLREAARHGERRGAAVLLPEGGVGADRRAAAPRPGHGPAVRIVTIDTGVLFEETMQTWRAFEERFGVEIEVVRREQPGRAVERARALLLGRQGRRARARARRRRGLDHGHPPRAGADARRDAQLIERDDERGLWKYNPLAHWTDKDLWRRIHERDLPYNPLHDQGYESIGCAPCTQPGSGREGRWAGTEKTECGIHVEVVEP